MIPARASPASKAPQYLDNSIGFRLSYAGDVNGDGYGDLLIGAPGWSVPGGAAVVLGSDSRDTVRVDTTAAGGLRTAPTTAPAA